MERDDNVTREKQVHLSLAGCPIDGLRFVANEEWCHWAAENSLLPVVPSQPTDPEVIKLNEEAQKSTVPDSAPPELQQQLSAVSAYYQSNVPVDFDAADFDFSGVLTEFRSSLRTENAFLRHVTLQARSSQSTDEQEFYRNHTRYYYAEMCTSDYQTHISSWLGEAYPPSVSSQLGLIHTPLQKAELGTWEPYFGGDVNFRKRVARLLDVILNDDEEPTGALERRNDEHSADASENNENNLRSEDAVDDVAETQGTKLTDATQQAELTDGNALSHSILQGTAKEELADVVTENQLQVVPDVTFPVENPSHNLETSMVVATPFSNDVDPNRASESPSETCCDKRDADAIQPEQQVSGEVNLTTDPAADAGSAVQDSNDVATEEGNDQEYVMSYPYEEPEVIGSAIAVVGYEATYLRQIHRGLRLFFMLLRPSWWVFYQTRWPPFTAPGYMFKVDDYWVSHFGSYFYRASAFQLMFELNIHSRRTPEITSLILMDPLALSPFSPVLNRVVSLPPDIVSFEEDSSADCIWMSIEWISPVQSLLNCLRQSTSEDFRGSALLSVVSLLSNWLAYFSRIELHGTSLSYSHYRDTYVIRPMGIACMYPATLGCGQIPLLDAWPLQLLLHSVRACCSTLVYVSSLLAPCSNFPCPRFRVSFRDVDCI